MLSFIVFMVQVVTIHLSFNMPLNKNCKDSGLANKATAPAYYAVAKNTL
jgi:hypothetical protein